jgi:hypothetical protein
MKSANERADVMFPLRAYFMHLVQGVTFLYTYTGLPYIYTENIEYYQSDIAGTTEPIKAG